MTYPIKQSLSADNQMNTHQVLNAYDDLKTSISSMQGLLLLISYLPKSSELEHYLKMMQECANEMDGVMVQMAKLKSPPKPVIRTGPEKKIDAASLVDQVLGNHSERIREHAIEVKCEITQNQVWIGDSVSIAEILTQLVSNCIAYRNPDRTKRSIGIRIGVTSHFVRMEVSDNGIGISPDHQSKIFEPFFKASSSSKGLGLGLFLVKEITTSIAAKLEFNSQEGEGSTFVITFPNKLYQ